MTLGGVGRGLGGGWGLWDLDSGGEWDLGLCNFFLETSSDDLSVAASNSSVLLL